MELSRINPLFLDSTKPIGDKVVTNVELYELVMRDGDMVYFEISDHFGFVQRFAMQKIETKKSVRHTAEVWLKYQHKIQYRFIIVNEGAEVLTSATREACAGHIISEKWEACFKEPSKPKKPKREPRPQPEVKKVTKPIAKPQFFDQLKGLIEDLL